MKIAKGTAKLQPGDIVHWTTSLGGVTTWKHIDVSGKVLRGGTVVSGVLVVAP